MEPLESAEEKSVLTLKLDKIKTEHEDYDCTVIEGFTNQTLCKVNCCENSKYSGHFNPKSESVTLSNVKHEYVETTMKTDFDYLGLHVVQVSDEHIACLTNYIMQNESNTSVNQTKVKPEELSGQSGFLSSVLNIPTNHLKHPKLDNDAVTIPGKHCEDIVDYLVKEESSEEIYHTGIINEESASQLHGSRTSLLLLNNHLNDTKLQNPGVKLSGEAHVNTADHKLKNEFKTWPQQEEIRKVILQLLTDVKKKQDITCKDDSETHGRCYSIPRRRRPYFCTECGKCFLSPSELKRHHLIHTGKKEHSCPECGKEFRQLAHLKSHLLIHSGEKPHSCAKCGKRFRLFAHLKNHLQIHKKANKYFCIECGEKFSSHHHINCHKQSHHVPKQ